MTYTKVKSMMEKDPDTTREQVMKACKCGELQATAWIQRFKAEQQAHKRTAFDGRYKGPTPRKASELGSRGGRRSPINTAVMRSGKGKTAKPRTD